MALKVRLPLNKDTRNVGLNSDNKIQKNGNVSLDSNGVFGNCYKFSGVTDAYLYTTKKCNELFSDNSSYSVSLWVKLSEYPTADGGIFGCNKYNTESTTGGYKGGGFGLLLKSNGAAKFANANSASVMNYNVCTLQLNQWTNIIITYDSATRKSRSYVNGQLTKEYTFTFNWSVNGSTIMIGRNSQGGWTAGCEKYINDFRIYDHCLSENDVERIYQCKVFGIDSHGWSTDTFVADTFDGYRQSKPVNIVATPISLKFNGNSYIDTEGISMTGGTLSAWFTMSAIPTTNSNIIYCDQKSKMAIGFYTGNKLIVTCNGFYGNTYIHSDKLFANKWNNVTIVYNKSDGKPSMCYINGNQATSSATNYWTSTGEILSIGRRYGGSSPNYFNGSIGKIDVYSKSFTENEILEKYESEKNLFLPDDYIQLEYIQSNGTQYIDTGIKPCMNKIRCVCDMAPMNGNDSAFFGARGTFYLFYKVSDNYFWPTSKCENIQGTLIVGNKYHVDWNKGTLTVTGNDGVYQSAVRNNSTQNTMSMYLFNLNPIDSRYSSAKLYNFQIYVEDLMVRYFVPSKRKSDNVIGLYDMVSRQFFTNSGTGSFTGA